MNRYEFYSIIYKKCKPFYDIFYGARRSTVIIASPFLGPGKVLRSLPQLRDLCRSLWSSIHIGYTATCIVHATMISERQIDRSTAVWQCRPLPSQRFLVHIYGHLSLRSIIPLRTFKVVGHSLFWIQWVSTILSRSENVLIPQVQSHFLVAPSCYSSSFPFWEIFA